MYACDKCDYKTTRLLNLQRHALRKRPCDTESVNINTMFRNEMRLRKKTHDPEKVMVDPEKVTVDPEKVMVDPEKVMVDPEKVMVDNMRCSKCSKMFSRKDNLKLHERTCDGIDKRQCKICLKLFATKQSKHEHIKYVKCVPPQQVFNNTTINNIDNSTTINNNNQQYITNIRLTFGNENIDKLCNEEAYMKRMENYIKMLKYALPKSLEDVYFNEDHPQNQTIKKDRKNDNLVSIHVGENKWEKRLARDMVTSTLEKINQYMDKYIEEVELNPMRRRELRLFGQEMSTLKYWSTESIEDRLDIENFDDPTEEEMKKSEKMVTKMLLDTAYDNTRR
jgi:hypothetical protein